MPQRHPQVSGGHSVQDSGEMAAFQLQRCECVTPPPPRSSSVQVSIQRILLSVCERAAETSNRYERHRVLLVYHLFVQLLLEEVKDGLGGAWAFVLRDVIYTLIHHLNSR